MLELEGFARLYHTGESAVLAGDNNFTGLDGKRTPTMRAIDLLYYIAQAQSFQRGCVSSHFSFKSFSSVEEIGSSHRYSRNDIFAVRTSLLESNSHK
jgi:hypothetical protein